MAHRISTFPSCKVSVSGGILQGYGHYSLRTMLGLRPITLPWRIDEFGPAEVFNNYCSSLIFLEPKIHFYWIIPALLFFTILLVAPASYRYIKLKRKLAKMDYKSKMSCFGLNLKGPMGNRKISLLRLFFYLYGLASATVDSCISPSRIVGNWSLFAVTMWPGESVCTTNGHLEMNPLIMQLPLVLEYQTGIWEHKRESDWGCSLGSCPSEEDCASMRLASATYGDKYISKTFCENYPRSCAFGHGCWFGKDVVKYTNGNKVYKFSTDSEVKMNKINGLNCNGVRSSQSSLSISNLRIVFWDKTTYLCPSSSNRGDPRSGQIGDIQMSDKIVIFDWSSVKCDEDWFRLNRCTLRKLNNIKTFCQPLPTISSGVKFYESNSTIYAKVESEGALVVGSCKASFITKEDECFDINVKMIGIRESQIGISIMVKAMSKDGKSSTIITLRCNTKYEIHVPCDGFEHFLPISENDKCNNVTDSTKSLSGFNSFVFEEKTDNIVSILSLHNPDLALYSSMWLIIIIFLMIIYCCCCKHH